MRFTDIFVRRPVLATVLSLLILLAGVRALFELPVRQFPRVDSTVITITTVYPGATSELMRSFITTPIEQAVSSAGGLDYLTSASFASQSVVTAHIRLNYDPGRRARPGGHEDDRAGYAGAVHGLFQRDDEQRRHFGLPQPRGAAAARLRSWRCFDRHPRRPDLRDAALA